MARFDTRPLRVAGDPEISLTEVERKRMYDMAMEMHDLQRRVTEVNNALSAVTASSPPSRRPSRAAAICPPR